MKQISVVIPHYQDHIHLNEALLSITRQSVSKQDVVIVDDKSRKELSRDSLGIVFNGRKFNLIVNAVNSGPSLSRNNGISMTSGRFLLFLDSDDILEPFCFEKRLACMDKYPENDIWVFPIGQMNEKGERQTSLYSLPKPTREENIIEFLRGNYPWQTMGALWRKETLQKLGGFNESMRYFEDPELALRVLFDFDIQFHFECDGPPDCYYRVYDNYKVTSLDPKKLNKFTDDKVVFFKSSFHLITRTSNSNYLPYLSEGIKSFLQNYALARSKLIHNQIIELIQWSYQNRLISKSYFWLVKIQTWLWSRSEHPIIKQSRIIGLLARIGT